MKQLFNIEKIQTITQSLQTVIENLQKSQKNIANCLYFVSHLTTSEQSNNESIDEEIKLRETVLDKYLEVFERKQQTISEQKKILEFIEEVKKLIEDFLRVSFEDETKMECSQNKLIDEIIQLKEQKMKNEIEKLKTQFEKEKDNFENDRKRINQFNEKERFNQFKSVLTFEEMTQLEEWTGMKCSEVLFDSNKDNWEHEKCTFGEKVMNRSNMLFIVEDSAGEKFGGYINKKVDHYSTYSDGFEKNRSSSLNDPKSFLFNIKSNGRLSKMMKFDIIKSSDALRVYDKNEKEGDIFEFGWGDFRVLKKHKASSCYCAKGTTYNYQGISSAMCGKRNFTAKRVIAIQLA